MRTEPGAPAGRRYGAKTSDERRAQRRERLVGAGLEAFGTDGFRGTAIERLCTLAGVSTRSFYEEFPGGREALLLALHDELNARALEAVTEAVAGEAPDDLAARVQAGVAAYFAVMTADRRLARIAVVETVGVSATAEAHRRAAIDRFAQVLTIEAERLAVAGAIPRRDVSFTVHAAIGALTGLITGWASEESWQDRVPRVVEEGVRSIVVLLSDPR